MSTLDLSLVIRAVNQATGPLSQVRRDLDRTFQPVRQLRRGLQNLYVDSGLAQVARQTRNVGSALGRVGGEASRLGLRMTAGAAAAGYAFKRLFLDVGSAFERFQTVLETTEGTPEAAKRAMDWVSAFAAKTPYELDQVTAAFVKLRSYGLDPTNGLLKTLGDTSAAMDKPLMQAVEAIADAVTGENERLKEFGIKAFVKGDRTAYEYTDRDGQQQRRVVDNRNRAMVEATLGSIWNDKYGGAMDKLSRTWDGMMSNVADQWTRFANLVMDSGLFDWMKGKLGEVLERLNTLADSGQLALIAQDVGLTLKQAFETLWEVLKEVWEVMQAVGESLKWLRDLFGSWKPIIAGVALVIAGPLLLSLLSLGTALVKLLWAVGSMPALILAFKGVAAVGGALAFTAKVLGVALAMDLVRGLTVAATAVRALGVALMTTPVGWIIAAVAAIAGAVYLIYKHWDQIAEWFTAKLAAVKEAFSQGWVHGVVAMVKEFNPFTLLLESLNGLIEAVTGFDLVGIMSEKVRALAQSLPAGLRKLIGLDSAATLDGSQRTEVGGLIRVEVVGADSRVREVRSSGGVAIEAEAGMSWVAP